MRKYLRTFAAAMAVVGALAAARADESEDAMLLDPDIFDRRFYAHHNGDLAFADLTTKEQLEQHWLQYGAREGRQASPTFDARTYLDEYADLRAAYGTDTRLACLHFVKWGRSEGRLGTRPVELLDPLALDDPNVAVYSPQNTRLGVVRVEPTLGDSGWRINQWATSQPILPDQASIYYTDPALGAARVALATQDKRLAVFLDRSRWVFELASSSGVNSSSGGSNIFLSRDLATPIPIGDDTRFDLDFELKAMRVVKTAAFDAVNVGQCFLGFIISSSEGVVFIQKVIAEANGSSSGAHVDPGTRAPLWTGPLDPDGALFTGDGVWRHGRAWLRDDVAAALATTYPTVAGGTVTIHDRDPSHWSLTSVYLGLETAGNAALTVQLRTPSLHP